MQRIRRANGEETRQISTRSATSDENFDLPVNAIPEGVKMMQVWSSGEQNVELVSTDGTMRTVMVARVSGRVKVGC